MAVADQRDDARRQQAGSHRLRDRARGADGGGGHGRQFPHATHFAEAGVTSHDGPRTCLSCRREITINDARGAAESKVGTMDDVLGSSHYRFSTERHPNVRDFSCELTDHFPMGKLDRPCSKPGSFAFTALTVEMRLADGRLAAPRSLPAT